jgi:hypothetical protein
MCESETLYLPVSLGEAIDKLTILDIKLARITDSRKIDVQKEHSLLFEKLAAYITRYHSLYTSMKKVNTIIWDYMDALRDGALDEDAYFKLCKKTIELNDVRFRIKNKINYAAGSLLKEQKGYKINRVLIAICASVDASRLIRFIRYYSCLYDQVVVCGTAMDEFKSDPCIMFVDSVDQNLVFQKKYTITQNTDFDVEEAMIDMIL